MSPPDARLVADARHFIAQPASCRKRSKATLLRQNALSLEASFSRPVEASGVACRAPNRRHPVRRTQNAPILARPWGESRISVTRLSRGLGPRSISPVLWRISIWRNAVVEAAVEAMHKLVVGKIGRAHV